MQEMIARNLHRLLMVFIVTTLAVGPKVGVAESLPETVSRLDSEVKQLRQTLDGLAKIANGNPSLPAGAKGSSLLMQLATLRQSVQYVRDNTPEVKSYLGAVQVLAKHCSFRALGVRVEGRGFEFTNIARVNFPVSESSLLAAEFEGYIGCDAQQELYDSLVMSANPRLAPLPPSQTASSASVVVKIPCNGALVMNRKLADADTIYWVVPSIDPLIITASPREISQGRLICTARLLTDVELKGFSVDVKPR